MYISFTFPLPYSCTFNRFATNFLTPTTTFSNVITFLRVGDSLFYSRIAFFTKFTIKRKKGYTVVKSLTNDLKIQTSWCDANLITLICSTVSACPNEKLLGVTLTNTICCGTHIENVLKTCSYLCMLSRNKMFF